MRHQQHGSGPRPVAAAVARTRGAGAGWLRVPKSTIIQRTSGQRRRNDVEVSRAYHGPGVGVHGFSTVTERSRNGHGPGVGVHGFSTVTERSRNGHGPGVGVHGFSTVTERSRNGHGPGVGVHGFSTVHTRPQRSVCGWSHRRSYLMRDAIGRNQHAFPLPEGRAGQHAQKKSTYQK
mgnify:CR=1 FL=1